MADYLTVLPPREVLQAKLQASIPEEACYAIAATRWRLSLSDDEA